MVRREFLSKSVQSCYYTDKPQKFFIYREEVKEEGWY